MGLFGQSTPYDIDIEKATSEKNTTEPWGVIMDICDKVGSNPRNAKDCLKAIMKRMAHPDPHVVIQAITLLDACVNNCGKSFHLEVASREFENEFKRLLSKAQPQVATKMRLLLKKWAEVDFKADPQLNLIPSLYHKLKSEGHDFTETNPKATKTTPTAVIKDPNVVTSQQEEDDIAKAIELSLKESKNSPKKQQQTVTTTATTSSSSSSSSTYPSLYPSFSAGGASALGASNVQSSTTNPEPRKVRALYDFEAAEDNELTFAAGDIIHVLDDSDPNWWKGYNQQGEGLFPSNFVTADLSVEPERLDINQKNKKTVQFEDEVKDNEKADINDKVTEDSSYVPEINEEKIDRLLHLLHEANPEDPSQDSEEMLRLEEQVNKMGPLIDTELERVDRKHAQLTQLSSDLVDAINLYHTLMREPDRSNMPMMGGGMYFPGYNAPPPPQNLYGTNPASIYGMQNMYHPPTSLTGMPGMMHMPLTSQTQQQNSQQQPVTSHPVSSIPPVPISTNFPSHPQMIPMQYQNGHQPQPSFPSNQQQQLHPPNIQAQYQLPNQPQAPHNLQQVQIPSTNQSTNQQQPPQQNSQQSVTQPQQQLPPHSLPAPNIPLPNPSFIPPNTSMPPNMFPNSQQGVNVMPSNMAGLMATGAYHHQMPQQSPLVSNGLIGGANRPPSPPLQLYVGNDGSLSLSPHQQQQQAHMSAINQPIAHNILGQNDPKQVIPIHQQR